MEAALYLLPMEIKSIGLEDQKKEDNCKDGRFIL